MTGLEEIEKPYSRIEWFMYIIILPLIFTMILSGIILHFLGFNVIDTALNVGHKVPGLASVLPEKKSDQKESIESVQTNLKEKSKELKDSQAEIEKLEADLLQKDKEIEQLTSQIDKLEEGLKDKKVTDEERINKVRELAKLYGGMSPGKAAPILEKLTLTEAATILQQMNNSEKTAILAKLNPEFAADVTVSMRELEQAENPEVAVLQERVKFLTEKILELTTGTKSTVSIKDMATTYSQMPAKQAALLLIEMGNAKKEFELGIKILANMTEANRSAILAEMPTEVARKYTRALSK